MPDGADAQDPETAEVADPGAADLDQLVLDTRAGALTVSTLPALLGGAPLTGTLLRHNQGNAATVGIWRIRGSAGSAVLKVLGPPTASRAGSWPTSERSSHWNYWRREVLAYTTGLAATSYAEAGISPPELLDATTRPDGLVELWLDDVSGTDGFAWPVPRIGRFAYELGVGQARWAGRVPAAGWLSRNWLAQYLTEGPSRSVQVRDSDWDHPGVAEWPSDVREALRRLWRDSARVLALARHGDRTLCHLDVWPANLIDVSGRSVLLDWSFMGEGAVGEDVANLVIDSFTDGLMEPSLLPELAETALTGYLDGLKDGGWSGSRESVRIAVAAAGAAKYSWFAPAVLAQVVRADLGTSAYSRDLSTASKVRRVAGLVELIAAWAQVVPD